MLIIYAPEPDAGLSRSLNLGIFESETHTAVYYRFGGLIDQSCDLSPNWVLMMPISLSNESLLIFSALAMSLNIWMARRVASLISVFQALFRTR